MSGGGGSCVCDEDGNNANTGSRGGGGEEGGGVTCADRAQALLQLLARVLRNSALQLQHTHHLALVQGILPAVLHVLLLLLLHLRLYLLDVALAALQSSGQNCSPRVSLPFCHV
jgi:hypothetical protein